MQLEFCRDLLKISKEYGIHTCLDTSAFTSQRDLMIVKEYVDLFLYDLKESNPETHKLNTGVDLEIILRNLDYLIKEGTRVRLRCLIVPGVTDRPDHFEFIANLCKRYPTLESIDILGFHNLGEGKYERVGRVYPLVLCFSS